MDGSLQNLIEEYSFKWIKVTGGQFPTLLLENIFSNNLNGSKVSINLYKFKYFYMQT